MIANESPRNLKVPHSSRCLFGGTYNRQKNSSYSRNVSGCSSLGWLAAYVLHLRGSAKTHNSITSSAFELTCRKSEELSHMRYPDPLPIPSSVSQYHTLSEEKRGRYMQITFLLRLRILLNHCSIRGKLRSADPALSGASPGNRACRHVAPSKS